MELSLTLTMNLSITNCHFYNYYFWVMENEIIITPLSNITISTGKLIISMGIFPWQSVSHYQKLYPLISQYITILYPSIIPIKPY